MKRVLSCTFLCLVLLVQICCGQAKKPLVFRKQALETVKIRSLEGWKEAISDDGRLRVLFPNDFVVVNSGDRGRFQGFKFKSDDASWVAYYTDSTHSRSTDEELRAAYRGSVEALTKKGAKLLKQDDIILNDRLGIEFVLQNSFATSYLRSFLIGDRQYILSVDVNNMKDSSGSIPQNIQQFFDSFTFWEQ